MVIGNLETKIFHHYFCPFHPSEKNAIFFEEAYMALAEEFIECSYCYGFGEFWAREKFCFQCEVFCSLW